MACDGFDELEERIQEAQQQAYAAFRRHFGEDDGPDGPSGKGAE